MYPDELEADFHQYFNLDVTSLDPAKAARLLFQLPRECRTYAKLDPATQWGWQELLLNKIANSLEFLAWTKTKPAQKKGAKAPEPFMPDFIPKPKDDKSKDNVSYTTDEIREILAKPRV